MWYRSRMHDEEHKLSESICLQTRVLRELLEQNKQNSQQAILHRLAEMEKNIMSVISEFATAQNAFNDQIDIAITDLQGDVKSLNDQIAALQASGGAITPADQALLDGIQARSKTIVDKLQALDALTPPVVPPAA